MSAVSARTGYWPIQLIRAALAVVVGLVITFSANHTAFFGLITFGVFAVASGLLVGWGARRLPDRSLRAASVTGAGIAVACGVASLVFSSTGAGTLFIVVIVFGAATGFLELYLGVRARGRHDAARDWLTVGVLTALLALAVLLVPADYALPWSSGASGPATSGVLTSEIIVVGIFGAYAILVGVYLVIAGLSARWSSRPEHPSANPVTGQ